MMTPSVYINTLGQFSISIGDMTIDDQSSQSKKPWSLLKYLITYRKREISSNELVELIWGEDESSNPGSALKTLLFRSRKLLACLDYPSNELIIQQRGSYAWNPEITTIVDVDLFEEYCKKGSDSKLSAHMQLEYNLKALDLYKGDFLPKSEWESWVVPISTYYHSLYQRTVHRSVRLLSASCDWNRIIEISQNAIAIEPFDEQFHYNLIYAFYKNGDQRSALDHYAYATGLFYNEFSITLPDRLRDLYRIIQDEKHGITMDLSVIQESLQEKHPLPGAFYCEYIVFRAIYQLEKRALDRTGESIYLCLMTIRDNSNLLPKSSVMTKAMVILGDSIKSTLRRGDSYTRYSVSQYLILLPSTTCKNGENVLKRICSDFRQRYPKKTPILSYSLQALLPPASEEQVI